jgi:hypothetical protein
MCANWPMIGLRAQDVIARYLKLRPGAVSAIQRNSLSWRRPENEERSRKPNLHIRKRPEPLAPHSVSSRTCGDVREQPKAADGASKLLQDVFGKDKNPRRLVYGVASLPLGTPVELEIILEVAG